MQKPVTMEENPLSFTSEIIGILTFAVAILVWLNQHLQIAMKLDDELRDMTIAVIQTSRENIDSYALYETTGFQHKNFAEILAQLHILELKSMGILLRALQRSVVRRIFTWEKERDRLKQNLSGMKELKSKMLDLLLFNILL
jgi:hypothetical protein